MIGLNHPKVCHCRHELKRRIIKHYGIESFVEPPDERLLALSVMECHGVSWTVMDRCRLQASTCGLLNSRRYPACTRVVPLLSVGVKVTIRPDLKLRSNVTDTPNVRN
jgi:hypothetical protein